MSHMQQPQPQPRRTTFVFDVKIVRGRNAWQEKFPEGSAIVDTWVDGRHYVDARVIEGFIVELADDSFGPSARRKPRYNDDDDDEPEPVLKPVSAPKSHEPTKSLFHYNFRVTGHPSQKPAAAAASLPYGGWPYTTATPIPKRGTADGMGLPKDTRIQKSTLDKVAFVDAVVVTDGSIVEIAQLTEPERKDVLLRPVVVEDCSIESGNVLKIRGNAQRNRRITNTVVVGTGNCIGGSMEWCTITGSNNKFECNADRVRVKGSNNAFCGKSNKSSVVVGHGNLFRNSTVNMEIDGSENVFTGTVSNATFAGDRTRFDGSVSAILK